MPDVSGMYRQAEDYFFKGISSTSLELESGVTAYMTSVPVKDLNLVYIQKVVCSLEKILSQGEQFFESYNLPFVVSIPEELCSTYIEGILMDKGYSKSGKSVCMGLALADMKPANITYLCDDVVIKANDDHLDEWMAPLIGAFDSTFDIGSAYVARHEIALKNKVKLYHFSLYKLGQPIASITLSCHNDMARIDDVGTLPPYQGKGYATHLMNHALLEAKRLGTNHCFLEASDSGLGIYQKLGFKELFKNNIYSLNV